MSEDAIVRAMLAEHEEDRMRSSAERAAAIAADFIAGKGIIANCHLGFGIKITPRDGGGACIGVVSDVIGPGYDGTAIRQWAEETAVGWLRQVAPHRLALGANDR